MIEVALVVYGVSLLGFIFTILAILTAPPVPIAPPVPPTSSFIGKTCPVGCTCFPSEGSGKPGCGYLSNSVKFTCPTDCCTPSCY